MGLFSFISKQFVDVIQWNEEVNGVLSWRYPMADQEIQYGASLTVRDSQLAIFVNEGKIADVFQAGQYTLATRTLPILTNLENWDKLFESPFKSDVVFVSTRVQLAQKWGTQQPITIRDADFGMIRMRAFGLYSYHVSDAAKFYSTVSGTREVFTTEDMAVQLRDLVVTGMSSVLGSAKIAFIDMAANLTLMSDTIQTSLAVEFEKYGLTLENFAVESVSLPENLQEAIDKRISVGMIGGIDQYTRVKVADSISLAAQNEGGLAGMGMGLGAGVSLGQVMGQSMSQAINSVPTPSVSATGEPSPQERLLQLKLLMDQSLITSEEYNQAKADILKKITG